MNISRFQFKDPKLLDLKFHVNHDLKQAEELELKVAFSLQVTVQKATDEPRALVALLIKAEPDQNPVFVIECTMQSEFEWDDRLPEDQVDNLLNKNAPALLLSYMRPIIHSVSNSSPYPSIAVPFMDFTTLYDEREMIDISEPE